MNVKPSTVTVEPSTGPVPGSVSRAVAIRCVSVPLALYSVGGFSGISLQSASAPAQVPQVSAREGAKTACVPLKFTSLRFGAPLPPAAGMRAAAGAELIAGFNQASRR